MMLAWALGVLTMSVGLQFSLPRFAKKMDQARYPTGLACALILGYLALRQASEPDPLVIPDFASNLFRITAHTQSWLGLVAFVFLAGLLSLGFGSKSSEEREIRSWTLTRVCLGAFLLTTANNLVVVALGWFLCTQPWSTAITASLPSSRQKESFQGTAVGEWIVLAILFFALAILFLSYGSVNLMELGDRIRSEANAPDFWLYVSLALIVCAFATHLALLPFQVLSATRVRESENGLQAFSSFFVFIATCGLAWNILGRALSLPLQHWDRFLFALALLSLFGGALWFLVVRRTNELLLASLSHMGGWVLLLLCCSETVDAEGLCVRLLWAYSLGFLPVLFGMIALEKNGGRNGGVLAAGWFWNHPVLGFAVLTAIATLAFVPFFPSHFARLDILSLTAEIGPAATLIACGSSAILAYGWFRHACPWAATPAEIPWEYRAKWESAFFAVVAASLWIGGGWLLARQLNLLG